MLRALMQIAGFFLRRIDGDVVVNDGEFYFDLSVERHKVRSTRRAASRCTEVVGNLRACSNKLDIFLKQTSNMKKLNKIKSLQVINYTKKIGFP